MAEFEGIVQSKIRMKLEEGAKGEIKLSVAIDAEAGEDEHSVSERIVKAFFETKKRLNEA